MVKGEEAGRFREVAGVSIVAAACPCSAVDTSTIDSRVSYYEFIQYYELGTSLLQILRSYTLLLKLLILIFMFWRGNVGKLNLHQNIMGTPAPGAPVVITPLPGDQQKHKASTDVREAYLTTCSNIVEIIFIARLRMG